MKQQQGVSLLGFLLAVFLLLMAVTVIVRIVPAFIDDYAVKRMFHSLEESEQLIGASTREFHELVKRRQSQNGLDMFGRDQLSVTRRDGLFVVDLQYEVRSPLVGNIDAVMSFRHNYELRAE
ncbi:MAG: DUF4845 domain-containing protein [Oleiphilaceae bacterium]|nr:DUF4845 domain-containing protein [Oleiphilaceae bacterium]